jgi:hypothetical protein
VSTNHRSQSVRNAWVTALRAETLRVRSREQAKVALVGQMIATYADADGGSAFPSRETLAVLCGCTTETISRAVAVLTAVGMLARRRRPNSPMVYQLLLPVAQPDWTTHMPLFTETRQKKAHAATKAKRAAELAAELNDTKPEARTTSVDAVRAASTAGVPDSVHGRHPGDLDSVHGRHRTASTDAIRTASTAGGTSTPTYGRYQDTDHNLPQHPQQPQQRAAAGTDLSLISETWQPNSDSIAVVQATRMAAGRPVLTGTQLAEVTRKFVRRMRADRWLATPSQAEIRWAEWAERERPTDTQQAPFLLGLNGGQQPLAWPHEQPQHRPTASSGTWEPPSYQDQMAHLAAQIAADNARDTG